MTARLIQRPEDLLQAAEAALDHAGPNECARLLRLSLDLMVEQYGPHSGEPVYLAARETLRELERLCKETA